MRVGGECLEENFLAASDRSLCDDDIRAGDEGFFLSQRRVISLSERLLRDHTCIENLFRLRHLHVSCKRENIELQFLIPL